MNIRDTIISLMSLDQAEKMRIPKDEELELLRNFWVHVSLNDSQYVHALIDGADAAKRILNLLNERSGKKFRPVAANLNLVKARLKEFSEKDLTAMVEHKVIEWMFTDMEKYLRPATLFNATKCAQYCDQVEDEVAEFEHNNQAF